MEIEPTFYRVRVTEGSAGDFLICKTYKLDSSKQFIAVEYYRLGLGIDDAKLKHEVSSPLTFQQELRLLHRASSAYEGVRTNEKGHMESKLKEAYGSSVSVKIEQIQK